MVLNALPAAAQTVAVPTVEYQVKASLVFNFLHFVTWPSDALAAHGRSLPVCLVGSDPYGPALAALEGQEAQGRTVTVRRVASVGDGAWVADCAVVVSATTGAVEARALLGALRGRPVLSIGEAARFLDQGGVVRFTIASDTVRFEINAVAARRARLLVSSKILRLADRVLEN